jgi:glycosyltransferase involved in cell wall biosynthesis
MRISVVTPSFNMAPYLAATIDSVVQNLRPGDEYFVIDGGSTDDSVDIIRHHEAGITSWISEPDTGYADAIAKGFERATGDILCWLNCSDVYLSGALEKARVLMERDNADLIFGDDFYIDEAGNVLGFSKGWVQNLRFATLYGGWTPLQEACFWRRDLYWKVGGIDRSLRFAADYDLFLRMSGAGRPTYVPVAFSAFRVHRGQKSISGTREYERERWERRSVELSRLQESKGRNLAKRVFYRAMMSARARLAPVIWRRPEFAGVAVETLRCERY